MCTLQLQDFAPSKSPFVTYLFWQKCLVLGNLLFVYSLTPLWVQNIKIIKENKKMQKNTTKHQVTPGDFCRSHSHHYVLHNFFSLSFYIACFSGNGIALFLPLHLILLSTLLLISQAFLRHAIL